MTRALCGYPLQAWDSAGDSKLPQGEVGRPLLPNVQFQAFQCISS